VPREKQQVPVSSLQREMALSQWDSLGGTGFGGPQKPIRSREHYTSLCMSAGVTPSGHHFRDRARMAVGQCESLDQFSGRSGGVTEWRNVRH
jgi:hypothetical protein